MVKKRINLPRTFVITLGNELFRGLIYLKLKNETKNEMFKTPMVSNEGLVKS